MAVGLRPCPVTAGKYAGRRGIEVTLDGRRVGELTWLMAQRYLPLVDGLASRGRQAGCEALLHPDHRGMQVELRLPAVDATATPVASAPTVVAPPRVSAPTGAPTAVARTHRAVRPLATGAMTVTPASWGAPEQTVPVPRPRPAPTTAVPTSLPPAPGSAGDPPRRAGAV